MVDIVIYDSVINDFSCSHSAFLSCQLAYFCLSVSPILFVESEIIELINSDIPCIPRQISGLEGEDIYR